LFHSIANGRRKKKIISSLQDGENMLVEADDIRRHITDYYKNLFGSVPSPTIHLGDDLWGFERRVSSQDNDFLIREFTDEEIEETILEHKIT
jgi:hypothetical protein